METRADMNLSSEDALRGVVQRVTGSVSFQRSPRLRELFLYICDRAIENKPEELREQKIGCSVFGRKPDYNPGEDNIVRVEIRQLRKRLEEFFSTEGKDEPMVIVIPKGAYVPVFEARRPPVPVEIAAVKPLPPVSTPLRKWGWVQTAVILALAITCFWLYLDRHSAAQAVANAATVPKHLALWPLLFNEEHQTFIVCADSSLVVIRALTHQAISLEDYTSGTYLKQDAVKPLFKTLARAQFTDIADARLVQRLYQLSENRSDKVSIRSARTAQLQDFKNGNIILLGSSRSNLWTTLFEAVLNFQFDYDEQLRIPFIRNRAPDHGELPVYRAASVGGSGDAYSTIALVPNLRHTGSVLMIAGTTGESTEATGEFLTNGKTAADLLDRLIKRNNGRLPYFEVLLKSRAVDGVARNPEIVAMRVLPEEMPRAGDERR
jgi:hypothetical protein